MSVIDDYLKNVEPAKRKELERVRKIIKQQAPDAQEVITYAMPGFKLGGKYLISFSAFKNHMSIFPGGEITGILKDQLKKYKTAKGTIQFTLENPLPETLIKKIIRLRLEHMARNPKGSY